MPDSIAKREIEASFHDDRRSASIATLRRRAALIRAIRRFFDDAGFFEVETPLLSSDIVVDAWLEPFVADWIPEPHQWRTCGSHRYLQTSPEFAMKRLIAAGADSIYQICKVFRNCESGSRHNPEFTMLEWYRRGDDLVSLMRLTESLVRHLFSVAANLDGSSKDGPATALADRVLRPSEFERLTYQQAFFEYTGCSVLICDTAQLHEVALRYRLVRPPGLDNDDRDGWLNFLLAELIEPRLGTDRPTFLTNYPASQAALARLSSDGMTAERFELYINGIELCNGYDELTDAAVLRTRIQQQTSVRSMAGLRPLPETSRLLDVMGTGLPACSGNALGVDRLIMLALGLNEIADVISFPFEIA